MGVVDGLVLDQRVGHRVERGPVGDEDGNGLVVRLLDQHVDLAVDLRGHVVGVVALVRLVATEKDLALLLTELAAGRARRSCRTA